MEIHVETRFLLYYVQTLSTLIGYFIPKLTDDRDDTDSDIINVDLTCVTLLSVTLNRVLELWTCCEPNNRLNVKCAMQRQ